LIIKSFHVQSRQDRHIPTRMFTIPPVTNINMAVSGKIIFFPTSYEESNYKRILSRVNTVDE
jgi:hypothetical protein